MNDQKEENGIFENLNSDDLLKHEEENDELETHGTKRKIEGLKSTEESIVARKRLATNETQDIADPSATESAEASSKEENVEAGELPSGDALSSSNVDVEKFDDETALKTGREDRRKSLRYSSDCPRGRNNVSYRIFSLGPSEGADNDCTKAKVQGYRILVRNQIDGVEVLDINVIQAWECFVFETLVKIYTRIEKKLSDFNLLWKIVEQFL